MRRKTPFIVMICSALIGCYACLPGKKETDLDAAVKEFEDE